MYAYQIFGIILRDDKELLELINETNEKFENFPGLISRQVYSNAEDQMASGIYLCKDKQTAEKVMSIVHEIIATFDEYYYILHEFIFRVIDNKSYECMCSG